MTLLANQPLWFYTLFFGLSLGPAGALSGETEREVLIGVRANTGIEQAMQHWQPTANYLSSNIPGYRFKIVPFEINSALNQAASRHEFDFFLTNPSSFIELKIRYGSTCLLTLINKRQRQGYTQFGSVIFTRRDRHDIQSFADLKNKSFMGAEEQGFGGWRVAWYELLKGGIDPYQDFSSLSFGSGIQQNVVYAVHKGEVDAGSVRTDMLERMAQAGDIQLKDFKVLGSRKTKGFSFLHSTALYPEWPFAKLASTDDVLANKVAAALAQISPDHPAAQKGRYIGWHAPLDYQIVDNLLKELHVGPYARHEYITFAEIMKNYWHIILITILLLLFFSIMLVRLRILNKQLLITEAGLLASNQKLRDMTVIDGLTGIGNRRKLNEFLNHNWGRVCRNSNQVCLMLIDIDYFKDYNDAYGHIAGDECLKKIAMTIQNFYRRTNEVVIRYGGEEFLIMITNCDPHKSHASAERLRQEIEKLKIEHRASKIQNVVTASIGIVNTTPDKNSDIEELISVADQALYQAKYSGRNRIYFINQ